MDQTPPDSKALRQLLVVGLFAFLLGMAGVLFLVGWLMWRFAEPDTRWYDLLHISVYGLIYSVIGGLAVAAAAVNILSWWQYRRGVYRCVHCGRPLKGLDTPCDCPAIRQLMSEAKCYDGKAN
jgi:hypothetical protein